MRIALVTRHADPRFTPLGLLQLKAALVERAGVTPDAVTVVELDPGASAAEAADRLRGEAPDILGLSCHVWNVVELMRAAALVRERRPRTRVVAGGPEVGPRGRRVLERHAAVDVVVKGEGEGPIVDLVRRWRAARSIDDVPGIWRRGPGGPVEHPDAPVVEELSRLPSPHAERYLDPTGRIACVETQRGCAFRCGFCHYGRGAAGSRRLDLDRVKAELAFYLERDVLQLYLMDPVFNLDVDRAKEICRFLAAHNHRRVPLHAEISAERVDAELAALMRAASFELLEVGLQTTEPAALAAVGRGLRRGPFLAGVGHLRAQHLPFEVQLILGLPGETPASQRRSLDFAASLEPEYLVVFPLMVLPGTELWRSAGRLGLDFDPEPPHLVRSTPTMDSAAIARGQAACGWVRVLWNSGAVRDLCQVSGTSFADLVERWVGWRDGRAAEGIGDEAVLDGFVRAQRAERGIPADVRRRFTRWEAEPCLQMLRRARARG